MRNRFRRLLALIALLSFLHVPSSNAQTADSKSLDEVNKELSNPISSIWALQLQENTYWLNKPDRNVVNLQFQPVLPLALTDNWNLITRPVFQVMNSTPYVNESGHLHRVTGFGDTILATMISPSPKLAGSWLLGAGPSFIFPTASNSRLGQNKWEIGPAGVFGYLGDKWLAGVFPQQWFSVGGPGPQNVSKVIKIGPLPVKFQVQGQYMPVHPDVFGQKWNLQFAVTPVIPKLITGHLLGD